MMKFRQIIIGLMALGLLGAVVAFTVLRPPAEATQPIEAIPLVSV